MDNFDPYNVLLAIATNIPVLLMTAFVLQGHIYSEQGLKLTLVKHQMRVTSAVGEFMKQCYSLGR